MSRFSVALVLAVLTAPALAQINPMNLARILQDRREVGIVYSVPTTERCRSQELWMLGEDYAYPGEASSGFDVQASTRGDYDTERLIQSFQDEHPKGTVVTVDIREYSADCR